MSRCFPFPPPGYEKKPRTDDVDLLKKEKHREKKHKKEKKAKEKRESKEKREKEGRDGKHKEKKDKKDKKEKHREKKKDKDKDRDKDKNKISTTYEKGFPGQAHGPNAVKPHQKAIKQNDKKGVLFEDITKQHASNNGKKVRENNHLAQGRDSKFLLELDRRIKDNDGGARNHLVQKFTIANNRNDEGALRLVAKGSGTLPDVKETLQDKGIDAGKIDGRGIWPEAQPIGNATVQNHAGNFHPRLDEMPRPLEKNFHKTLEATVEGKGKVKEKKDDKRGDKRKDKEKEKKGHGKDKDRDKEKKKEEKAKEHTEHKIREQNKLNESNKAGLVGSNSFTQVSKHSRENSAIRENLKKRKDIESNGVLHANDNWPTKLPRTSSSHPFTENGRILDPCQISLLNALDRQGAATNVKVDDRECKINGIIEALPSAVSSNKTPNATVPADPINEASARPPHPDTKYLSQVYSIPKTEAWSDFDDQEWLFGTSCSQERKPLVKSSEAGDTLQVWAEAVHIEPGDIFALPYVIPY